MPFPKEGARPKEACNAARRGKATAWRGATPPATPCTTEVAVGWDPPLNPCRNKCGGCGWHWGGAARYQTAPRTGRRRRRGREGPAMRRSAMSRGRTAPPGPVPGLNNRRHWGLKQSLQRMPEAHGCLPRASAALGHPEAARRLGEQGPNNGTHGEANTAGGTTPLRLTRRAAEPAHPGKRRPPGPTTRAGAKPPPKRLGKERRVGLVGAVVGTHQHIVAPWELSKLRLRIGHGWPHDRPQQPPNRRPTLGRLGTTPLPHHGRDTKRGGDNRVANVKCTLDMLQHWGAGGGRTCPSQQVSESRD